MPLIGMPYRPRERWWAKNFEPEPPPPRDLGRTLVLRRRIERLAAGVMAMAIAAIVVFFIRGGFLNRMDDTARPDVRYSAQITALAEAQATLAQLNGVLTDQRKTLEERQGALDQLRAEHTALSRVLAVDRAAVDEIFEQQRRMNAQDVWKERGVAFLLGILSGLLTALILHWVQLWRAR